MRSSAKLSYYRVVQTANIIPLNQVGKYPLAQVGRKSLALAKSKAVGANVNDCFVIPVETLRQIAYHNSTLSKIRTIIENSDWSSDSTGKRNLQKIGKIIRSQKIPKHLGEQIHKAYAKHIGKDFAKIMSAGSVIQNIKGETNLIESIFEIWAQTINVDKLTPKPILVMAQKQPLVSGVANIHSDKKYIIEVRSLWGAFGPDSAEAGFGTDQSTNQFQIDTRTWAIITRHINPQTHIYERKLDGFNKQKNKNSSKASLTDERAIVIAKLALKINQQFIGKRIIFFEVDKENTIITDVKKEELSLDPSSSQAYLIGKGITGGHIEGYAQLLADGESHKFITGNILVKKALSHNDVGLINQASAIIIESHTLEPNVLRLITANHIPCILGVRFASTRLSKNIKIILDASSGKIFLSTSKPSTPISPKTITKIYLSAGNPFGIEKYPHDNDGIFLKSDFATAYLGIHPDHLIKSNNANLAESIKKTIEIYLQTNPKSFFYRVCNLNSSELRQLNFGTNYENEELNPYLGTRGALKTIINPLLFDLELKVVYDIAHSHKKNINVVLPFVRTASELAILFKKIQSQIPNNNYLKFWLQLNTPANVMNLTEYLRLPISGITFQAKTIHDLAYGIDPDNPELTAHYPFDSNLVSDMLDRCVSALKSHPTLREASDSSLPLIVKLNNYQADFVASMVRHGVRAIVVKPQHLDIVKRQVLVTQEKYVNN